MRAPEPLISSGLVAFFVAGCFVLLLAVSLIGTNQYIGYRSCANVHEVTSKQTRYLWGVGSGCFVKVDNQWVPIANWREIP